MLESFSSTYGNIPLGVIDTHCHLYLLAKKDSSFLALYEALQKSSFLKEIWDIGIDAHDYPLRKDLLGSLPWVRYAIGLHPNNAHKQFMDQDKFLNWAKDEQVVLIGETGLDFYRTKVFEKEQRDCFIKHIELANLLHKPLVVHVRAAEEQFLQLIRLHKVTTGGIWHCFSGEYKSAKQAVDRGFKISFAGNLTYKNNQNIQETAKKLPAEALLVETDAPYLAPVPVRGKINHSGNLNYTLRFLSDLRQLSLEELVNQLNYNSGQLLGSS